MKKEIQEYERNRKSLLQLFNCEDEYFIKSVTEHNWRIVQDEGIVFLNYWLEGREPTHAVIAKKDGQPLIYPSREYTMVVAIDCIKIAFILNNSKQ